MGIAIKLLAPGNEDWSRVHYETFVVDTNQLRGVTPGVLEPIRESLGGGHLEVDIWDDVVVLYNAGVPNTTFDGEMWIKWSATGLGPTKVPHLIQFGTISLLVHVYEVQD
jgi:hypothetical protein